MESNDPPAEDIFVRFFQNNFESTLLNILREPDIDAHYGLTFSLALLAAQDHAAAEMLLASPRSLLPMLDAALVKSQQDLLQRPFPERHLMVVKQNVHARIIGLSTFLDRGFRHVSPSIADIGAAHAHRLITVRGTVARTGAVKLLEARRLYECTKCKHRFVVAADLEAGATVQLPMACPSSRDKPCSGSSFRHCEEIALYTNFQEIRLQQGRDSLAAESSSRSLVVMLQDELADSCQVGESVEVTGIVVRQFGNMYPGMRCHVGLALQATGVAIAEARRSLVEVTPEAEEAFKEFWRRKSSTPLVARDHILSGMCPQLCGLFTVKLASLLMLIGGVSRPRNDDGDAAGVRYHTGTQDDVSMGNARGEIHFLLVGDPGTGKSQFQRYISKLSPRSVVTSGKTSSAAGLTAAAVKDGAHWSLEAGALVLADGGVCCIDEFDAVREADRAALHEAMEQQTCSIAKAGIMTTLHTRAAVFGTCNPKGHKRYNPRRPLAEQLNVSGPLLSRFDIVLLLIDDLNPVWDEAVADHILKTHRKRPRGSLSGSKPGLVPLRRGSGGHAGVGGGLEERLLSGSGKEWSVDALRQYIAWVRTTFTPKMTPQAEDILGGYYRLRRGVVAGRHASRTTLRLLESSVRMAQAHARLMARGEVLVQDAVVAVALLEASVVDGDAVLGLPAGVGVSGPGDGFMEDPEGGYRALETAVLAAVRGLENVGGCGRALLQNGEEAGNGWR